MMTNLYLVEGFSNSDENYGDNTLGVFSSIEKAKEAIKNDYELDCKDRKCYFNDDYWIYTVILDEDFNNWKDVIHISKKDLKNI